MAPAVEVVLPEKVEEQLRAICAEKSVAEADVAARKLLLKIGEQEALKLLSKIRNSRNTVRTLSGFITHLYKELRNCSSPLSPPRLPLTNSPQGDASSENKRKRDFENSGNVISARRVCYFGSPTKIIEEVVPDPPKSASDLVLDELEKLEFGKAFLILNYAAGMSSRSDGSIGSGPREGTCDCGIPVVQLVSWTPLNPGRRFVRCKFYIPLAERKNLKDGSGCNYWKWVDEGNNGWQTDLINGLLAEKKELQGEVDMWKDKFSASEVQKGDLMEELAKLKKKKGMMKMESKVGHCGMSFYVFLSITISLMVIKIFG